MQGGGRSERLDRRFTSVARKNRKSALERGKVKWIDCTVSIVSWPCSPSDKVMHQQKVTRK